MLELNNSSHVITPCRRGQPPHITIMTLRILYNGSCPICAREIGHYLRMTARHGASIAFDDLNTTDLTPWGLDAEAARRRLHALNEGRLLVGLDAFRALWSRLPGWRWLARLTGLPVLHRMTRWFYDRALAPWLYRRSVRACTALTDGACARTPAA